MQYKVTITRKSSGYYINHNNTIKRQMEFGGIPLHSVQKVVSDENMLIKISQWFAKNGGEKETVIINAIGRVLLAPFLIAYNPFSEEKRDTKVYAAWKQPISGLLGLIIQLPINIGADKLLVKMAKKGQLGDLYNLGNEQSQHLVEAALKRFKVFRALVGVMLGLLTIPPICSLLNYVYPKFMELAFPNLARKTCNKQGINYDSYVFCSKISSK